MNTNRTSQPGQSGKPNAEKLQDLRKPLAGDVPLSSYIDPLVREGELYEKRDDGIVHCYACAHNCVIKPGGRGVCQVRYNLDGTLYVPWGYVSGVQSDPIEKKPFNHVLPGTDTLTFGMLGCDMHCSYCFTGDTVVITDRGPVRFDELFNSVERVEQRRDGQVAHPENLRAVAASGRWRIVRHVYKHSYKGKLAIISPYSMPELRCTADHRVYTTTDPNSAPEPIPAKDLTRDHYLIAPQRYIAKLQTADIDEMGSGSEMIYQMPSELSPAEHGHAATVTTKTEDYVLIPLEDITFEDYEGDVYNMAVEEEHNYLANFFLVKNCQNWDISQTLRDSGSGRSPEQVTPQQLVQLALHNDAKSLTSSYNEPLITSEWAVAVFKEARAAGLSCNYVSNGNATRGVLEYIRPYVDAYKIDLKSMDDKHYRSLGAVLDNILDGIRMVHELGFWLEIVTLVVPGFNDSDNELRDAARFIKSVSADIPWHVTAFHKDYRMVDADNTDPHTLLRAAEIGYSEGLHYVYAGNIPGHVESYEHTRCPSCHTILIKRIGYVVLDYQLTPEGTCSQCQNKIPGLWPKAKKEVRLGTSADLFFRVPRRVR